ncbi:MAG TPA: hypothetical protein PKC03_17225, partial [Dokdonella sp.]|nr:hypothetical protein [Dokdonella sp.]
ALARYATVAGICALAVVSLGIRARVWGDPVSFVVTEAARHPNSPRATYDLGRTYVLLSGYRADSEILPRAIHALEAAARVPNSSLLPEAALIMVSSRTGRFIDPAWWKDMVAKLESRTPTTEDASAIKSLTLCQREGKCVVDDQALLDVFVAAMSRKNPDPAITYSYAIFALNRLHDADLALRLAREAARSGDIQYQLNLVNFLIDLGLHDEAAAELAGLKKRARPGSLEEQINASARRLDAAGNG